MTASEDTRFRKFNLYRNMHIAVIGAIILFRLIFRKTIRARLVETDMAFLKAVNSALPYYVIFNIIVFYAFMYAFRNKNPMNGFLAFNIFNSLVFIAYIFLILYP